ncbi:MAG: lipocalin-like domain-containing protein [Blastocatellia bacterium]
MKGALLWGAILGLLLPAIGFAQQKKEAGKESSVSQKSAIVSKLIGTWKLMEFAGTIDGQLVTPLNAGRLTYDASGQVSLHMMVKDRPKFASDKKRQSTKDEAKIAFDGYVAYFGRYRVDETAGVVIHSIEGSIFPNEIGKESIRFYELSGDRLTLRVTSLVDGKILPKSASTAYVIWERVK